MKLCIIATCLFSGGFTTSMLGMLRELKKQGIETDVLFLEPDRHEWSLDLVKDYHVINAKKVRRSRLDIPAQMQIQKNRTELKKYEGKTLDKKEEIRKTMLSVQNYVLEWFEVMDLREYDCVISWEELTCNYFLAFNVKAKRKVGYIHPDYELAMFAKDVDAPALKKLDKILCCCKANEQTLIPYFPEMKDKITTVYTVMDTVNLETKVNLPVDIYTKSSFDIVTICRLAVYHKGLDRLVRVASLLEKRNVSFEWYLIGEGPGRSEVESLIQQYNVTHLHLLGMQANPYPFLKKADLFVLTSNYEGLPVVVNEAMYFNTPVCVTSYASVHEQVRDGENGFICPMEDEAIADRIAACIEDPSVLQNVVQYLESEDKSHYTDITGFLGIVSGDRA